MKPVRLFDSFLTPPAALTSLPVVGQLGMRDGALMAVLVVVGMRLGSVLLGWFGLSIGLLGGLIAALWLRQARLDDAPLLAESSALLRYWMAAAFRPDALGYDPTTDRPTPARRTVTVTDAHGTTTIVEKGDAA